ncbi:MAG: ribonuclease Y [Nitrospirae bacterium]|nr:ribonuclease Y [Nitrospirota bacterium]
MPEILLSFGLPVVIGAAVAGLLTAVLYSTKVKKNRADAQAEAARLAEGARKESESAREKIEKQARDQANRIRTEAEQSIADRRREIEKWERKLRGRDEVVDQKYKIIEQRQSDLQRKERTLAEQSETLRRKIEEADGVRDRLVAKVEEVSGLSREDARKQLAAQMEAEAKMEVAKAMRKHEEEARKTAEEKAKHIIVEAIQRWAGELSPEATTTVIDLQDDEVKGRIIGREGRNIRAFEAATGVDVVIDDTPGTLLLSSLNPVRREVARVAIKKLIGDGRIHPGRIEEVVERAKKDVDKRMMDAAEKALLDLRIHGMHPELVRHLGQLLYRTSYSQNVLYHSVEAGFIGGIIAVELGLDQKLARRICLLHDIGKAVSHEVEGTHMDIAADLLRRCGESEEVIKGVEGHHEAEPPTIFCVIAQAADAISGARPGARLESLENYVKRVDSLEKIAQSFPGVEKAYAIQAGREIRVAVDCKRVNDDEVYMLSKDIANKIQQEMTYPGEIKVTVIREVRGVEVAH